MIYTKPDYYDEFHCTADKCEDTCCAGWQIVIDNASLKKYRNYQGDYIWKIMACVDWATDTFRQDKEKRCAFLNEENLCELYKNAGEHMLCKTCREYPRHTEEFEGVREITLSISCPEVARILMNQIEPVKFVTEDKVEIEEIEDFGDFDPFLFSILEDARLEMINILQNRDIPLKEREMLVLGMAHDMQGRINRSEMFACSEVITKYTSQKARKFVKKHLAEKDRYAEESLTKELFSKLYKLELLREEWEDVLHRAENTLFYGAEESFSQVKMKFAEYKQRHSEIDIHLEQILVYFLFTYFPGAVYDGAVFAKAQMAVYCTEMVELLWMAEWLDSGRTLDKTKMTRLLYRFSREVEHSDENLKRVDKMMEKKWLI